MEDLLSTILQWTISDCLNKSLYDELVEEIPNTFDSLSQWTDIFQAHVYEDMRASLEKDLIDFSLSQTLFDVDGRALRGITKSDPKKITRTNIELTIEKDVPGALVIFVKYGGSNLTSEIMANSSHFFGNILYRSDGSHFSRRIVEFSDGVIQHDCISNDGKGWMMFFLATGHIPNLRILQGLKSCKMKPELISEILTCRPSDYNTESLSEYLPMGHLNLNQSIAISRAISAGKSGPYVQIIEGPPGTGKTSTLIGMIYNFLQQTSHRIHVTAPTNHAVCELARRAVLSFFPKYPTRYFILVGSEERLVMSPDLESIHLNKIVLLLTAAVGAWTPTVNQLKALLINGNSMEETSSDGVTTEDSGDGSHKSLIALKFCLQECRIYAQSLSTYLPDDSITNSDREILIRGIKAIEDFLPILRAAQVPEIPPNFHCDERMTALMQYTYQGKKSRTFAKSSIRGARVVFSTVSQAQSMDAKDFNIVIVDEATQLVEASTAILLSPTVERLVLVGDNKQLPPTVISNLAKSRGYDVSLFDRLLQHKFPTTLLNVQYRMHPDISRWPNKQFYRGKITDGDNVRNENYTKPWHQQFPPFVLYDVNGTEEETEYGSFINKLEINLLKLLVRKLYGALKDSRSGNGKLVKVGIITPYKGQLQLVTDAMNGLESFLSSEMSVVCKTVDGFQGQECDIIFFLSTRSKRVGFLGDKRRLNVAITRAKYCLIFIGNLSFLKTKGSMWEDLVAFGPDQKMADAKSSEEVAKVEKKERNENKIVENFEKKSTDTLFEDTIWYQKVKIMDSFKKSFPLILDKKKRGQILVVLEGISNGEWAENHLQKVTLKGFEDIITLVPLQSHILLWSIDLDYSIASRDQRAYHQVIKIWDIVTPHDAEKISKRIAKSYNGKSKAYLDRCNKRYYVESYHPKTWLHDDKFVPIEVECSSSFVTSELDIEQSCGNMKHYTLSSHIAQSLFDADESSHLEYPHDTGPEEKFLIDNTDSSLIVSGRSGTGKTTTMLYRMHHRDIMSKADGDDDCPLPQMLLTKSALLAKAIKTSYNEMILATKKTTNSPQKSEAAVIPTWQGNQKDENRIIPFNKINILDFPLIETFDTFLRMIDKTLSEPFFRSTQMINVDLFVFESTFFPNLGDIKGIKNYKVTPSSLFVEIMSVIKGSLNAVKTGEGALDRQGYVKLGEARNVILNCEEREHYYNLYEAYSSQLALRRDYYDTADFVAYVYGKLSKEPYKGLKMEMVYIDEVQDLTPCQICILKFVCGNPTGFFFAGDTAQTIASGVDFGFNTLKDLFYEEFLCKGQPGRSSRAIMPSITVLSTNYRTHKSILALANLIVKMLSFFFPSSIESQKDEVSFILGPKPVFLSDENDVITALFSQGEIRSCEFGSDQVILVRDAKTKEELIKVCMDSALVLTPEDAKGMEFTDCLVYNYFSSSELGDKWRFIGNAYEHLGAPKEDGKPCPEFEISKFKSFIIELKRLYVLVTRAKRNLVFFDKNLRAREPFLNLLKHPSINLVIEKKFDDEVKNNLTQKSDPDEWCRRGREFYERKLYREARQCFSRGGDVLKSTLCDARVAEQRAHTAQGETKSTNALELFKKAAQIFENPPLNMTRDAACLYEYAKLYAKAADMYLAGNDVYLAAKCFKYNLDHLNAAKYYAQCGHIEEAVASCFDGKHYRYSLDLIDNITVSQQNDALINDITVEENPDSNDVIKYIVVADETDESITLTPAELSKLRAKAIAKGSSYYATMQMTKNEREKNEPVMLFFVDKMESKDAKKFLSLNKLWDCLRDREEKGTAFSFCRSVQPVV